MLPTEDLRNTEICDFEVTIAGDQKIFWLDVSMSNPMVVQIANAPEQLFETAKFFFLLHERFLNEAEQIAPRAIFHDVTPSIAAANTQIFC